MCSAGANSTSVLATWQLRRVSKPLSEADLIRFVPVLALALSLPALAEEPDAATFTKADDVEAATATPTVAATTATPTEELAVEAASDEKDAPVSLTFTNDLEIRYWVTPQFVEGYEDRGVLNYFEQVERFTAHASTQSGWQAFAQIDQVLLTANAYKLDGVYTKERVLRGPNLFWPGPEKWDLYANPEKLYISKKTGNFTWRIGDFYEAYGYGISLNVNRNVDIDIDSSIQGARVFWQPGAWDVGAFVGQLNRQQVFQDNPNIGLRGDLRHFVMGTQIKRYGLGPFNIGAHAVAYNFVREEGPGAGFAEITSPFDAVVGGASAEYTGGFDLNGEFDVFTYPSGELNDEMGYAAYGSAAFYFGPTTWQLEGKRYKDSVRVNGIVGSELYSIAVGPTLEYERATTEDSAAAVGSTDIYGGRLRMDWAAVPGEIIPYVSMAVFRDLDTGGLHFNEEPETVFHPVVGVEALSGVTVLLNTGYRVDRRDGGGAPDRQLHGDIDFKFPVVGHTHADVAVAIERYQWGDNGELQQDDYVEMETAVTFLLGEPDVALIWYTDITTNPLVDSKGNLDDDLLYGAFELQYQPSDSWTLKAFYGAYKAGIRCSGGQCRQLPGFEGGRVSVTGTF